MAVPKAFITDTELELLKVLWTDEPLTAREIAGRVYGEASSSSIGTVQKLIQRLEEKDLLKRDRREAVHLFSTRVTREAVAGMQLQEFADKLSDGSLSPFLMHLVQAERLSKKDRQVLRRLLGEEEEDAAMDSFFNCVASNVALAGALALVAFGVTRVWRSPQLAHALWLLVLVKLVTPPIVPLPVPERWFPARTLTAVVERDIAWDSLKIADPGPVRAETELRQTPASDSREQASHDAAAPATSIAATSFLSAARSDVAFGVENRESFIAAEWRMGLCLVWGVGVLVYAVLVSRWLVRFRALMKEAVCPDSELRENGQRFATLLGLRDCPPIRVLDVQLPPLVCAGWRGPFVLIPQRLLAELDRDQRQAVLVHELAHIRRRDHLVRWFEILVCGLFWWNPLAWWAARQLRRAEEECCDAWVVWVMPDDQQSYGKALLRTVEFLAERRAVPAIAGAAFGGPHIKRRIEMIMTRTLNRRMSWGALLAVIVSAVCVLPVAAQKKTEERGTLGSESTSGPALALSAEAAGEAPKQVTAPPATKNSDRDLEVRIERLERLIQELAQTVTAPTADSISDIRKSLSEPVARQSPSTEALETYTVPVIVKTAKVVYSDSTREVPVKTDLKSALLALDGQAWSAAGKREWTKFDRLLRPGYHWGYFGTSRNGPTVGELQSRRYFDRKIREVSVGKITDDVAFLTYVYDCKVEDAGEVQAYENRQSMQIWTKIDGKWLITYTNTFNLARGE